MVDRVSAAAEQKLHETDKKKAKGAKRHTERRHGTRKVSHHLPVKSGMKTPKWAVRQTWRRHHPDQEDYMTGVTDAEQESDETDETDDNGSRGSPLPSTSPDLSNIDPSLL